MSIIKQLKLKLLSLEGLDPTRPMDRPEVSNIWNNPGEIMIDDNVDPEKNKDEIDLSSDEDECFSDKKRETIEQEKEEEKDASDDDSDDGAPQARPFTLPFLPAPTKMEETKETKQVQEKTIEPIANVEPTGPEMETTKPNVTKGGFKRRNQAIYTKEDDDE